MEKAHFRSAKENAKASASGFQNSATITRRVFPFFLRRNRSMRTVTNMLLVNLAFSDLLIGVVCMPFTLFGVLLKDFIFGSFMCRLIPYLQGA